MELIVAIPEESEEAPPSKRRRSANVPLPPAQAVKVLRARYPQALVCTRCAVLLATQRVSYAKSNLTETQRLAFICAECKLEIAEADRTRASRLANAEKAREVAHRARQARKAEAVTLAPPAAEPVSVAVSQDDEGVGANEIGGFSDTKRDAATISGLPLAHRRRRGGWKPGDSRQARYRRRHPERAAAELRALRARQKGEAA